MTLMFSSHNDDHIHHLSFVCMLIFASYYKTPSKAESDHQFCGFGHDPKSWFDNGNIKSQDTTNYNYNGSSGVHECVN